MADDSKIVITAGLQIPETVQTITKDLKQVAAQLNANHALKIVANIDLGKSTQRIQSQLATIGKDLKINVASINAQSIQSSIDQTVKSEPINISADIQVNTKEIKRQADELKKMFGMDFAGESKENIDALNAQLQEMLTVYDKAMKAGNINDLMSSWEKLSEFVNQYSNSVKATIPEVEQLNSVLKQSKVLITEGDYKELENAFGSRFGVFQALNNALGIGKWSYDPSKASYGFDSLVNELNSLLYKDNLNAKIPESIAEGIQTLIKLRHADMEAADDWSRHEQELLAKDENAWETYKNMVLDALYAIRGEENVVTEGFVEILADQEVSHIEQNAQTIQNSVNGVTQSIQNLSSNTGVNMNLSINTEAINQFTSQLQNLGVQGVNIDEIRNRFQNLGITINQITPTFKKLDENGANVLSSVMIKGRDATNQLIEVTQKFKTEIDKNTKQATSTFDSETTKIVQDFEKIRAAEEKTRKETDTLQKAKNKYLELLGKANVYMKQFSGEESLKESFQGLIELLANFRETDPIEKQQEAIIKLDNELKLIKIDIDEIAEARGQSVAKTQEQLDALAAKQLHLLQQYQELEAKITKSGTTMSAVAIREDNGVKTDYSAIFNTIINGTIKSNAELKKAQNALTTIRNEFKLLNAQTGSTLPQNAIENFATNASKLHNRFETLKIDYDEIKNKSSELSEKFEKLSTDIKQFQNFDKASISTKEELREQILAYTEVKRLLDEVRTATTSALNAQSKQESEYKKLTSSLNDYIKALQAFNNSSIVKKNSGNADVQFQTANNASLISQLQGLSQSLSNDSSAANLQRVRQVIDTLSGSIEKAITDSAALNQQLRNMGADQNLANQIRNLTNQVSIFANTNRKATESLRTMRDGQTTFADEWQRIKTALSSGTLDDAALKRLAQDFRNFKGEADSAGLTVNRFFQSMQSQLRMVLQRWISLYAVIGYIRKMIDAVKELDTAMINLKRVTDETDTGYERFLNDANELARTMKTTTSSLVEQAYQWSKLGFSINEALELAQASTVFMKVADVGQDQALSNLVTTLKAFRIEADQTMDVVDKLDKLNNRYAVSASGLGQGLERAASTMAMSGNTLEETLAMLTGAGEITQSLEETGNGIKILSLRLRGMKGALEELNEPVDDLMEVSKVQTQILNLTHNQVNIFDEATQEFRSTYDIMKDISDIWDSLSSTSRSNLTEILFGKQRSNIGLALIQAFQSGQVTNAFEDVTDAAGTATEEYEKMMNGVQAQFDALKGAAQEFANAFIKSDFVKGFAKFGTWLMSALTTITNKTNALVVVATPLLAFLGGKYKTNIFTLLINGIKGLVSAETGAITATGALTTALEVFKGALSGLAIGALIAAISWAIDELVVSESEMQESIDEITDSVSDLADATKDLRDAQSDIESTIASYSKIATTVADVNERKTQLLELQNNLQDTYKGEADGIDLVNGKYSEQIKKMKELAEEERKQYEIENADKIAKARRLANLYVEAPTFESESTLNNPNAPNGYYDRKDDKKGDRALFTLKGLSDEALIAATNIEGVYRAADFAGVYLSGTLEDARNQLGLIIENYKKFADENDKSLTALIERYKELGGLLEDIKEASPYIEDTEPKPFFTGVFDGLADAMNQAVEDVTMQPFYDKLDEAQEKLKQLANPSDLTIAEYDTLYRDVQNLEHELYKMAGDSETSRQAVADLFNGFKQGTSENGDHLEQFMERFNTTLEESFKSVAETVTNVQDALNNLAEGKGLSHNEAWKLLKEDTDGYLQSIKLVNGEYFFSQEELIKFKDAKIQASIEELKASNEQYVQERENLTKQLSLQKEELKLAKAQFELDVLRGKINSESDYAYMKKAINDAEIAISETEESIKRCGDLWTRNNYLIEELNQNLGDTRTLSLATETELNNAIKGFENEVKAIEDTVDELNNRKDILESEKDELQNQLELLKEQKKALEDQQKTLKDAVEKYMKRYEESLQAQLDAIKQQKDDVKDAYDERIKALKTENEERDLAYKKEKALLDLNKAKEQQVRTYSSARGWEYGASKEEITKAQKDLDDVLADEQIQALEKERDEKVSALEKQEKEYDKRIKAYQEYARKYEETTEIIENADGELLAEQLLGADWRDEIEKQDEELLASYKREYSKFADEIDRLTKNEIADIEASIKAKEAEIDKIGEEINAYNNYKDTVKNRLDEAKKALEEYKNSVDSAKTDVVNAMSNMADGVDSAENRIWDKTNRIKQWFWEVGESAKALEETLTNHLLSGDIDLSTYVRMMKASGMGSFANGGQIDYTGLAMVHGSKSNPEVVFNAADSKKLYDMIHNTPNLIASVAKQASQINPTNVKNSTNTNSVNVNIGQVVANNPQELTRNLDTHLDSYFRRKLAQGYAQ